ncbi:MAG TPA: TIGR03435 family protein [Bryobacteraceae bacterium]|jgi:uncharacterized protein (TIGR03435 family)
MKKHLLRVAAISVAGLSAQGLLSGQSASPATPKFEVASVKECKAGDRSPPTISSPGRLSLGCWNLKTVILQAYEVFASGKVDPLNPVLPLTPVEGDPAWINSARYSIDAKAETPQSGAMMRGPMMQALLEERFHMRTHREIREVPVYLMTVDKGGPKFRPTKEGSCLPVDTSGDLTAHHPDGEPCAAVKVARKGPTTVFDFRGFTLAVFAGDLHPDGRHVIDRTGLAGPFDIHLELETAAPDSADPGGAASDPLPVAMRQQLGLRLVPGKGPVEFLVIDHIEKPSEN